VIKKVIKSFTQPAPGDQGINTNNLLTESEGSTGKYLTEDLLYWPSDSEV
jgi:hypothetical protein